MRAPRMSTALVLLLAVPSAHAAPPGSDDAATDGVPFALDAPDLLAALEAVRADISGQRIHDCIAAITSEGATQFRLMGTPTHDAFLDKHEGVFEALGLLTARQDFAEGGPAIGPVASPQKGGTNLIGVLPGRDIAKWVVVGGHYDTRELTFGGGAYDNASGICTVEELARAFKAYVDGRGPLAATVVFIWYDGEEWGLFGSSAFAKDPAVAKGLLGLAPDAAVEVLVSQSYDMAGLNYPAKNTWVRYGDPAVLDEYAALNLRTAPIHAEEEWTCWSYGCYDELKTRDDFARILDRNTRYQFLVREVAYDLLALPREYVWVYDDHYGRSDHIPLIALGAAGNRIQGSHDEEYPHYHQPTDTLPALYELAGSKEALVAGFVTEAQAGGLVAFYAALTGDVGPYGPGPAPDAEAGRSAPATQAPVPALALAPTLALGLALALALRSRR